ncbi:hypothetical protein [Corynebacterium epidermidicanis]|uniref:LemA family protein n=1 Tax=Corynebacterium epidermidicanis TaxID=1050174 RepID=A0A0G3GRV0_9CORY|nr:hypothetical protein [Corynebacterium epidermidicanis]AKK03285.1 hypothetical protein CEPID_07135 [Corynebacterium epidermidicanis]
MTLCYLAIAVCLTFFLAWAYFTAQRLNRLHIRVDTARNNLGAALDRRAVVAQALVPQAAREAETALARPLEVNNFEQRSQAERALLAAISGQTHPLLVDASARVQLAHRFYNDAVTDTRALRTRPLVRIFRLGGTARLPEYYELPS